MSNESEQYTPPEAEGKISLRDLLTYDNPNCARYQEIIRREHDRFRVGLPEDFANNWSMVYFDGYYKEGNERYYPPMLEKLRAYFKKRLQGGNLIDLGGGSQDFMAELAKKSGTKKYINVDVGLPRFDEPVEAYLKRLDPYVGRPRKVDFWRLPENERTLPMETVAVNADMLDFISRLPENSSNFAVNGIDSNIIRDDEYCRAWLEELIRATRIGGIIFGVESSLWRPENPDPRLKSMITETGITAWDRSRSSQGTYDGPYRVFEKIKE